MGRWPDGARSRLERAALELFVEQGFAQTTVPQITARAGLTTRTFFRHFSDKREVLFGYQAQLPTVVARILADCPPSLSPMEATLYGFQTVATEIEGERDYLRTRRSVVESDDGLRERELRKQSVLSDAITDGLQQRGVDGLTATVAAAAGASVFSVALIRWLDSDETEPLSVHLQEAVSAFESLLAAPS